MCPASVKTSRASRVLETGEAKLWVLLIGVNQYQDQRFPPLSYPALDCQGLSEAIVAATQSFPQKTVLVHHDLAGQWVQPPQLAAVSTSLQHIVREAQPQDTVLFYFSGHGILEPDRQQAVLCLNDTQKADLLNTGLSVSVLLSWLENCAARQQLVWLDACHSGGMSLRTAKGDSSSEPLSNPTPQLMEVLRQRASQSKGFYALLSCDHNQQSWEFPELGHGVFSYFLMRGLLGEAADEQGIIEADALYKYVYYQTLRYIDGTNQQLRLINQQKRGRGVTQLQPEYPLQTPKRIVEGVGELILGIKPDLVTLRYPRQAIVVEGISNNPVTLTLSKVLRLQGCFELHYFPQPKQAWSGVQKTIAMCLQIEETSSMANPQPLRGHAKTAGSWDNEEEATVLLYLRGQALQTDTGEARLRFRDGTEISRSWLRQALRRSPITQQIVILDFPGARDLAGWVEDLQTETGRSQCIIVAASPITYPEAFTSIVLETLSSANPQVGLSIATWIAQIQTRLAGTSVMPQVWLAGSRVMEFLPGRVGGRGEATSDFDIGMCPYLGLRAFSEDDAPFFFGREGLTQQILAAVAQRTFLAIVGASGSGKSSVAQAGLMAHLRQGKQIPGSEQWWVRCFRPGDKPVAALIQSLVQAGPETDRKYQQLQIEGLLYQGVEGFVHWVRSRPEPIVVLVVDQFEELFTLSSAEERSRFLAFLMEGLAYASDRLKLVLTLRTDFIAPCLEYPALAEWLQQSTILVPPVLSDEDYRQVILRPAEKVGLEVQPELVDVLLQELSYAAGDLPLLEFVLEQLWEQRHPGELTLQVYHQQIGGLKGALERKAQAVYDSLDPEAQDCARWIFLALTQLGEGTEDTRRRVSKSDLVVKRFPMALIDRTLEALTAAKLVVVATATDPGLESEQRASAHSPIPQSRSALDAQPASRSESLDSDSSASVHPATAAPITVEVAHEILIRHWSTLRWWLEENRTRLRSQRQIEQAAAQWINSGQQADFLLRGIRLDAAEELYVKYTDELSQDVQQFIEAGLQARQQEKAEIKQRLQRARAALVLISTLGLVAVGFGGFAYWQRQQTLISEIATLNALSESQLLSNHQLEALTIAMQASRKLQQVQWLGTASQTKTELQTQTIATLQQAVGETQERNRFEGHTEQINSLSLVDERIASGSDDGTVRLWQEDGTLVNQWETAGRVRAVALSPDGKMLASASVNPQGTTSTITIRTIADNRVQQTLTVPTWVTSLAWSPNRLFLAAGGRDRTARLWNVTTGKQLRTFIGHQGWVNCVRFSPDGRTLASAGGDNTVKLWNIVQGQLSQNLTGRSTPTNSLTFSPDGKILVAAGEALEGSAPLTFWNLTTGSVQPLEGHSAAVNSVQFSPDGKVLLSASADGTLKLWRLADGILLKTLRGHEGGIMSASFSADGQTIFSGGLDRIVRSWDIRGIEQPVGSAYALSVSPDNHTLATAGWDGKVRIWAQADRTLDLLKTLEGHSAPVSALSFNPEGNLIASGSDDQTLKLWNPVTGTLVRSLTGHQARITSLSFSPDGSLLASGSDDQTIRIWNPTSGQPIRTFTTEPDSSSSLAFSPDGRFLAAGGYSNTIKLWQVNGTLLKTLTGHQLAIATVVFSPDSKTLASASWDNTIKLWRVQDGTLLQSFKADQSGVTSLSFSPDGAILASGGADHTLKLWNLAGEPIKTLIGSADPILSLTFNKEGTALLSANEATGVHRWMLNLERLMGQGCDRLQDYLRHNPNVKPEDRTVCS